MFKIIIFMLLMSFSLNAYESEDKLKVVIIGKIAKYITYKDKNLDHFTITVLKNPFGNLFSTIYHNQTVKSKPVKIVYLSSIEYLRDTDILYIPKVSTNELLNILEHTRKKNIITISDSRGFAQRGGLIQLYFVSQKLKLKINTHSKKLKNMKINPALLRVSALIKGRE